MRLGLLLAALVFVAAGCTDARQRAAARAVENRAGHSATCTKSPRFASTTVFLCDVKSGGGLCDRYRATLTREGFRVELDASRVDCVLPPS